MRLQIRRCVAAATKTILLAMPCAPISAPSPGSKGVSAEPARSAVRRRSAICATRDTHDVHAGVHVRFGLTVARFSMLVLLIGCTPMAGSPRVAESAPSQVIVNLHGMPPTLNPLLASWAGIEPSFMFSFLTRIDAAGRTSPDLVTTVPTIANGGIVDGGRELIYHLRHGIRWQDGPELTAADVVFTYEAITSPTNASCSPVRTTMSRRSQHEIDIRLSSDCATSIRKSRMCFSRLPGAFRSCRRTLSLRVRPTFAIRRSERLPSEAGPSR